MRNLIGFVLGLYFTVALVVGGAGAYAFATNSTARNYDCPGINLAITAGVAGKQQGSPNWIPYVLLRGIGWPYFYFTEKKLARDIPDWLLVKYDPFPKSCGG